jgi:hypothetical protein
VTSAVSEPRARLSAAVRIIHPLRTAPTGGAAAVPHAVHGLVLFVAIVGATFVSGYPAWKMLLFSAGAVVLFWVTHVYATTLGHHQTADAPARAALGTARGEAIGSLPILEVCLLPAVPLILAALNVLALPAAYAASLTTGILMLALVGFLALSHRHASLRRSLLSASAAAGFGAAIIAAETFWH